MITIGTARAAADLTLASDDVLRWDPAHRASRQACAATCIGWDTSFEELARILA